MKIILSPSKTRNSKFENEINYDLTTPKFIEDANFIASKIKSKSKEEISLIMKIKNSLLEQTVTAYNQFEILEANPAIYSYSGTVFNEINVNGYNKEQTDYLAKNVRILSALYGVLRPFDIIKNYRLDMNTKVLDISNYVYWKNRIDEEALGVNISEEVVLCLASGEFSKMLNVPYVNVEFRERVNSNKYKVVGMYSKKARGKMLDYLVSNRVNNIDGVHKFSEDGYSYNEELSTIKNIVFTR